MGKRVLITGGAGFIGSHLADDLLRQGHDVRVLDVLSEQVHGPQGTRPDYLARDVEVLVGDIRDRAAIARAISGVDAVYHFAAVVGVGQSMYQAARYTEVNNMGTALLLEAIVERPIDRLIVASSMSLYGEGLCMASDGRAVSPPPRSLAQLKEKQWELRDSNEVPLKPVPTPETKPPAITSVYALSKYDQERMCLLMGSAYGIPTVALRFFNVFGSRQALSNPYTGVMAIFASRLLNRKEPLIFEDGEQRRDFVHVHDVARAARLALTARDAPGLAINVGSGAAYTVREISERMAAVLGATDIRPRFTQSYRVGDIRHCFADISLARRVLGYEPAVSLENGLQELVGWLNKQTSVDDKSAKAHDELAARGLTV